MTVLLFLVDKIPNAKAPELLVLRGMQEGLDYTSLYDVIKNHCKYYKEKARSIKNNEVEMIIEIRAKEKDSLLQKLNNMDFITQVNCISHDGEYRV